MSVLTTRVVSAQLVAPNVINLKLAKPSGFSWKTGEFARIGLRIGSEDVFRAYSIASPAEADTIDFFIAHVKGGTLSPRMNSLKIGDSVLLDSDVGGMLLPDRLEKGGKDLWMFASGTGVAPFMAILRDDAIVNAYEHLIIVHGVRTWAETEYVARLVRRHPKLQVFACVTREKGAILSKRIPEALTDGSLEQLAAISIEKSHSRVMLCGNPAMVKSVREILKSRHLVTPRQGTPGQMLVENFWL